MCRCMISTRKSLQRLSKPDGQDMIDRRLDELNTLEVAQLHSSFLHPHNTLSCDSTTRSNAAVTQHHIYLPPPLRHYSSSSVTRCADSPHDEKKLDTLMHQQSSLELSALRSTPAADDAAKPELSASPMAASPSRDGTSGLASLLDALKVTPVLRSKSRWK